MRPVQLNLLELPAAAEMAAPEGFAYRPGLISPREETALIVQFAELPFREFEFHGFFGKRRTVSYGLRYDFGDNEMHEAEDIPDFLLPLRDSAAAFAGISPARIAHALVTEYAPGAAIGWHRDRPAYDEIIGVSFASPCRFRFRRRLHSSPSPSMGEGRGGGECAASRPRSQSNPAPSPPPHPRPSRRRALRGTGWERRSVLLDPRSAYILRGAARHDWEHSIPPAEMLRYSATFRTLRTA